MVEIKTLLPELRALVGKLAEDLLARSGDAKIGAGLREAFQQIKKEGRTAQAFEVWRDDYLDQVSVAWVLACVFVRFMEDNGLIDECWLAGEGQRRRLAEDSHELFFRQHSHDTDREYFQHVFKEVGQIPAAKDLFAEGKTPLWAVAPSGDAAMSLLKFWREINAESGHLQRSFQVESGDTRFLGDLYQELSEKAKDKYALLQTPVFVEEFILDRTLTPTIAEFGLEKVRMIDPTCGSGHFLLGGFTRLFDLWSQRESNEIKAAQKALDGVWGVDINPFAVGIARFRLIVAAVQACKIKRLKQAPGWNIHLATGDSLLFGSRWNMDGTKRAESRYLDESWAPEIYACEDKFAVTEVLGQQYHAVVGNPPYILAQDKTLNKAYRTRYSSCSGKYSLCVPFIERFFELACSKGTGTAGFVGAIVSSSFSKNQFGKPLVQRFLPRLDLTHVIDTSDAYIPGHNTATLVYFGRNRSPVGESVRCVLGIRGEQGVPENPSKAKVWSSIVSMLDTADASNDFISVSDIKRSLLSKHPWSLRGGGISQLKERIDAAGLRKLKEVVSEIGVLGMTNADEVFIASRQIFTRHGVEPEVIREIQTGDTARDWSLRPSTHCIFPYQNRKLIDIRGFPKVHRRMWPFRTTLGNRATFEGGTYFSSGLDWWKWHQIAHKRLDTIETILFTEIATGNHFVFVDRPCVFNQTGPIIKFKAETLQDESYGLTGVLNCSTACLWMKETCRPKGGDHVGKEGARVRKTPWDERYAFSSNPMKQFPVPSTLAASLGKRLCDVGKRITDVLRQVAGVESRTNRPDLRSQYFSARTEAIFLQEELDWHCYKIYGLITDDLTYDGEAVSEIHLGQRAFEIVMARQMTKGELETTWFKRHGSTPITEIPFHWPTAYRNLVERRIKLIQSNKDISLIEKPEYKRRWNSEPWEGQEQRALKNWLLDRLESSKYRKGTKDHQELTSTAQMADVASADTEFLQVAVLYRGRPDFDLSALVTELVESEAVPFLPTFTYKPAGLRKRAVWEQVWEFQRQQDQGKDIGDVPVPPEFSTADFASSVYWGLRGRLDVPKERWVSYPHCSTDSDPTLLVGWAGWNHLEQATALIAYYDARKREGWDAKRLSPLLTCLDQLLPWIHQWHPEIDPEFGETAGQSFQTMLEHDAHELGLTLEDIRNWTPPEKARMTRTPSKKKSTAGEQDDA